MKMLFLFLFLLNSGTATAAQSNALYAYRIDGFGGAMQANAINSKGQVAGSGYNYLTGSFDAFVTGPVGIGTVNIGQLGGLAYSAAYAINDDGVVVGDKEDSTGDPIRGFVYSDESGVRPLFEKVSTSSDSPRDINNYGLIVGSSSVRRGPISTTLGFVTRVGQGQAAELPILSDCNVVPTKINDSGIVAGQCREPTSGLGRAVTVDIHTNHVTELGLFGGISSLATGINDAGDVVGVAMPNYGSFTTFAIARDAQGMLRTGLGGEVTFATDIAVNGSIVGYGRKNLSNNSQVGFIGKPKGRLVDANRTVANLPEGVVITKVSAVNSRYQMAAVGSDDNAYIVCPTRRCK